MKVTHVAASLEDKASGPAYIIPALVAALATLGADTSLRSIGPPGSNHDTGFEWLKFRPEWQTFPIFKKLQASAKMNLMLSAEPTDIIHNHGLWLMPNIYGSRVKSKTLAKLVTSVHGMLAPNALQYSRAQKILFGMMFQNQALANNDLFHATSAEEVQNIRLAGWKQPIALIPLGIDIPTSIKKQSSKKMRTILYLGRVHPIKRLGDLVTAWSELENFYPGWQLRIVGSDENEETARLKLLIGALRAQRIEISGPVFGDQKSEAYSDADIYVLPSQSENFSMTVAEALAHAVPVICSKGAPWSELEKKQCGWWPDIGQSGLKVALRKALDLPGDRLAHMGAKGRKWIERDFSIQAMAEKMHRSYDWLLRGGPKPDFIHLYEKPND